jgi:hypothetical protein
MSHEPGLGELVSMANQIAKALPPAPGHQPAVPKFFAYKAGEFVFTKIGAFLSSDI